MVISNILFKLSQYYATLLPKAQSISDHLPKIVQFLPLPHKTLFNIFQFILNYHCLLLSVQFTMIHLPALRKIHCITKFIIKRKKH